MSWQGYVDDSLVGSHNLEKAAIISVAGDATWASSSGFVVNPTEMKYIAGLFGTPANDAFADGVHVNGERYLVTRFEGRSCYCRKGRTGIIVVKTTMAILIGYYGENIQAGNAASVVERLADYLISSGY